MSINENYAFLITERISFPRLIGTNGEKKAREIIVNEFQKLGYDSINRENFKTSFYNLIFVRYIFFPYGFLLILLGLSFYISHWITLGLIGLILFLAFKCLGIASTEEIKLMKNDEKNYETENIYVNLKGKNSIAKVVLIGHYDSKGQSFPVSIRKNIFTIAVIGVFIILMLYLTLSVVKIFINFYIPILNHILLSICMILAIIGILNFFNKTNNRSNGACDNAGGVGTIIELARYFKENPTDNIDITFLLTSSEEINLGGSKYFISKHKNEFDQKSSYFINFDPLGTNGTIRLVSSYGIPRKNSSKKLNDLFETSAKELNISVKSIYLPTGVWSDYLPIANQGFEVCWLASLTGLKHVHTIKDDINIISKEALKNVLRLSIAVIKKLDSELENRACKIESNIFLEQSEKIATEI